MNRPKTVEEWDALAAQIKAKQHVQKKPAVNPVSARRSVPATSTRLLSLHIVQRPKKGKFKKIDRDRFIKCLCPKDHQGFHTYITHYFNKRVFKTI